MKSTVFAIAAFLFSISLTAPGSANEGYAGLTQMNQEEVVAIHAGKSHLWTTVKKNGERIYTGGAYFDPDGTAIIVWERARLSGEWRVNENGEWCLFVSKWHKGKGEQCFGKWFFKDEIWYVWNSNKKRGHDVLKSEIIDGDQTQKMRDCKMSSEGFSCS